MRLNKQTFRRNVFTCIVSTMLINVVYANSWVMDTRHEEIKYEKDQFDMQEVVKNNQNTNISSILALHNKKQSLKFVKPINAKINSKYGIRFHPILKKRKMHTGVDFAAAYGTPIRATENGVVLFSSNKGNYGNTIIVKHIGGFASLYAHASKLYKQVGDIVLRGDVIAAVGSTGMSTGNHLHFELFYNGERVNPEHYIY